jgi:hypothetical protein
MYPSSTFPHIQNDFMIGKGLLLDSAHHNKCFTQTPDSSASQKQDECGNIQL